MHADAYADADADADAGADAGGIAIASIAGKCTRERKREKVNIEKEGVKGILYINGNIVAMDISRSRAKKL